MIKSSLAALVISGFLNSACVTAGDRIVSPPIEIPVLELSEESQQIEAPFQSESPQQNESPQQTAPQVLENIVQQSSQTPEVKKPKFPLPLGTYNYDMYKKFIKVGSSQVVFENYNSQGSFSTKYIKKQIDSLLETKKEENLYYLKFSAETIFGPLALQQTYETIAFAENNKIKPLVEVASGEENYINLFYTEERRIHKLGRGELTLSEEDFDNTCDPLTLLVRLMSTKASKTTKKLNVCNFYAKELERISINIEQEGDNFCGVTSLPPGVFFGSENLEMKFYYFQKKDEKLYPVMNYELHINPKGLGWFVFKFTGHENN